MLVPAYNSLLVLSHRVTPRRSRFLNVVDSLKVIAHRGASHLAPENTLASVELAWQLGADAVEVDVHLTRDGRIVAIHDTTTGRTADTHLEVAATYSQRLRLLDVGRRKHPGFAGQAIPFLEEVIETVPPGRQLFIEIKCGPEILPRLKRIIVGSGKRTQIEMIGFDLDTMKAAKATMPDVPAHWLCEKRFWAPYSRLLAKEARAHGLDGLDVHWSGITRSFISAVREAGLKLYTWTVDEPADAVRLRGMGVDGITTNRPGWLRGQVHDLSPILHRVDAIRNARRAQPGECASRLASVG